MIFVVMGVAGSGKTTTGALLAEKLKITFYDADSFHPESNVAKMAAGIPLTDQDRAPWLSKLQDLLKEATAHNESIVLACSSLKQSFRNELASVASEVYFVYLKGTPDELAERLTQRKNHFMKLPMLASQLEILEEPLDALATVRISLTPEEQVAQVLNLIGIASLKI